MRVAVRFPLHLDIVLSTPQGDSKAVTEDVSANGMLFMVPAVGSEGELWLTMPAAILGGRENVLLHRVGRIVRHTEIDGKPGAAAVIDDDSLKVEHV